MVGMEASLLSAAVTGILKILGDKLAPLVIKEYSSIVGVKKDLQELQDQVREINCKLERARDTAPEDAPWLKKLKDVVYDVDDIVDEFQLKAEKHEIDGDGGFVSKCLLTKKAESLVLQCRAAGNIKKIKKRFAKIVKQRKDMITIFGNDHVNHINKTTMNMQTLPVEEATVLGRDQEMHQIISDLVENNDKSEIKIVSIVGLGGSGKTTLAKQVFNDGETIKNHFDVRLWVHVSQELFDIEKIIKKLYDAFADKDQGQPSLPYMSKRVQEGLAKKKFLIVMDDVWTEFQYLWDKIMGYLKNGAPGSGVLITTRSADVAKVLQSTYQFCLQRLSPNDSWQLFQQSLRSMPTKFLESNFIKVGKEIVETCCGLPLAIKVLAGSLGGKELIEEWQAMRDKLLDIEGEDSVSACLKLSYFHLPSNLKRCFTMCSLFPKGHWIHKQQLIDQWIAHDMIWSPGVNDLEHIGNRYFDSLVQVYFLQDVGEYEYGSVTCKMHDLIHDLARSILCEEISTIVPEDATSSTKGYRFFSLTEPRKLLPKKVFGNARAIYLDNGNDMLFGSTLKNAKLLRSIIIENSVLSTPVLSAIFEVKNLKYLEMSDVECETLPEAITDVWCLQALYLELCNFLELPGSIGKLKKLRTLNISWCSNLKAIPDSIGDCQMLSTLDLKECSALEELPNSISRNKRLRVLRLVSTRISSLPSGITALENLEYLTIKLCSELVGLPEDIGKLIKLKELDLDGYKGLPPGIGKLTQLEKLNMFRVETEKKYARISELATLPCISGKLEICFLNNLTDQSEARRAFLKQKEKLRELTLSWGSLYYLTDRSENAEAEHEHVALDGLEPPLGIKQIKIRGYAGGRFASWMLKPASGGLQGHGQFPFLTKMSLGKFPNLKHLDGLMQLPCLEKLDLVDMPALESISGGPFPALAKVKLEGLHNLGEVWIGKEGEGCSNQNDAHQSGQLQVGSRLTDLHIENCPELVVKPHFPISLEHLRLHSSNDSLLLSQCQGQGSSSSSNSPPCFSHLKVLYLWCMDASLPLSPPQSPGLRLELLEDMSAAPVLGNLWCMEASLLLSQPPSPGLRLELLEHMSALESLDILGCSDITELPEYLGNLSSLQRMSIRSCDLLTGLPQSTGRLTSLRELIVEKCHAFVQFPESLGELRSLRSFEMDELPVLTFLPESLCHLTSLQKLKVHSCHAFVQFPESLGELRSLCRFDIWALEALNCLPKSLCHLTSLKYLRIGCCYALVQLPQGLGELCSLSDLDILCLPGLICLPQSLGSLMSLQELDIVRCEALRELPECLGELHRLRELKIWGLRALTCLPQSLCRLTTSLEELRIQDCPGIKSLPQGIKGLTALQRLVIRDCPDLESRCEEGTGEDWHLISHIPDLQIGEPQPHH